ncbi:MAG: replicative DNA helicase [Paludibacter sp.]|nr:replicative DNA helicase [Paludibacter sp.]
MAERKNYSKKNTNMPVPANEYGKLPPQAPELEEAVLGAIMLEKDAYSMVSEILKPDCFYKMAHQKIFEAIMSLALHQEPVDMHTVTEQLRKNGTIDEVGGPYYITLLTAKVSSAAHLEYHARIIVQKYLARELIRVSTDIQTKAFDDKSDIEDLMQEAEGMLFELSQNSQKKDVTQINPVIEEARKRMQIAATKSGASGCPSGFHALDKLTSGWQKSDLIIIAARPAMGKTAFILSMAKNMAVDFKNPVAVFSLEMSNVQLVNRLIMNVCQLEGEKIKNGQLEKYEWEKFDKDINLLLDAPLYIDDTPSLSVFELRSKARRLVKEHHVQCLIIDYLQLMNASGMSFGSREQEVSIISRSLKGLAKELDIPIIALSQLNRGVEGRTGHEGKRPQLSDLRESGAIEQDADMVCFIHRPEYYRITEDNEGNSLIGLAEVIVAKHRNGATDIVSLKFKGEYAKFMNKDDMSGDESFQGYQTISSKLNDFSADTFYGDGQKSTPPNFLSGGSHDETPF